MLERDQPGRSNSAPIETYDARWILRLSAIHKHFGGVHALRGADFEIGAGQVVALVGDNGAGKSTLVKTMAGVHQPDEGAIYFDGQEVHLRSPDEANHLGIETVYQDLALCDNLDVVGNMYLGRELGRSAIFGRRMGPIFHLLTEGQMASRAKEVLRELQVTTIANVRTEVAKLSGGQRQAVAIARATMWNSRILMLDEPTAALGVQQTEQVLELVVRLRSRGLGVVLISHNLDHVFKVADRIDVLRLGRRVLSVPRIETTSVTIVQAITGAYAGESEFSEDV